MFALSQRHTTHARPQSSYVTLTALSLDTSHPLSFACETQNSCGGAGAVVVSPCPGRTPSRQLGMPSALVERPQQHLLEGVGVGVEHRDDPVTAPLPVALRHPLAHAG